MDSFTKKVLIALGIYAIFAVIIFNSIPDNFYVQSDTIK